MDDACFQRLPEYIKHVTAKFGQLVEEEDAVVCETDFTGSDRRPTADEPGVADRVMRGSERALRHQPRASPQRARDRVDASGLECFVQRERGQDPREPACEHRLARPGRPQEEHIV